MTMIWEEVSQAGIGGKMFRSPSPEENPSGFLYLFKITASDHVAMTFVPFSNNIYPETVANRKAFGDNIIDLSKRLKIVA
jgi:hypothetical protein